MSSTGFREIKAEIIKSANMGGVDKSATCMYRRNGKRYCAITSHEKCGRCKFYEPSLTAVYDATLEMVHKSRAYVEAVNSEIKTLNGISKSLRDSGFKYMPERINRSIKAMEVK